MLALSAHISFTYLLAHVNLLLDSTNGGAVAVCSNGHAIPSNLMLSKYDRLRFHIIFLSMTISLLLAHFHCTKISYRKQVKSTNPFYS